MCECVVERVGDTWPHHTTQLALRRVWVWVWARQGVERTIFQGVVPRVWKSLGPQEPRNLARNRESSRVFEFMGEGRSNDEKLRTSIQIRSG